jgi:hypothetical protein
MRLPFARAYALVPARAVQPIVSTGRPRSASSMKRAISTSTTSLPSASLNTTATPFAQS